jgi:hypothetical protein
MKQGIMAAISLATAPSDDFPPCWDVYALPSLAQASTSLATSLSALQARLPDWSQSPQLDKQGVYLLQPHEFSCQVSIKAKLGGVRLFKTGTADHVGFGQLHQQLTTPHPV